MAYTFGEFPPFKCTLISAELSARDCVCVCVIASVSTTWRSVCSLSHSRCPQAAINYRRVSSARTPTSAVPLCNTGCIIIQASNTNDNGDNSINENNNNSVCNLGELEVFLPPAFCQPPLSGITAEEASTECTKIAAGRRKKIQNNPKKNKKNKNSHSW